MNQQRWLLLSLILSLLLLAPTMANERLFLNKPYQWSPALKLPRPPSSTADSVSFWEATLNGNAKAISKKTKEELKALGLAHIYTPSGLHLSLILNPFFLIIKNPWMRSALLGILFLLSMIYLPGWAAVKRVLELKLAKTLLNPLALEGRYVFLMVMFFDLAFGTYKEGPLSFCFSFLFLSLLYARMSFLVASWWFFIAQIIIAIFLEQHFFLTNLFITPILTLLFSFIFPILIILRIIPAWHFIGEFVSEFYLNLVSVSYEASSVFPKLEATPYLFFVLFFILFNKRKMLILSIAILSAGTNSGENQVDANYLLRKYYFVSREGKGCQWEGGFEKCSYRSRSTRRQL